MKRKIIFFYNGYYFFVDLAKSINADLYRAPEPTNSLFIKSLRLLSATFGLPRNYEYYFCEGTYMYPALAKKMKLIDSKIITICGDPTYYYIKENLMRPTLQKMYFSMLKEVDGFVCASKMTEKHIREIFPNANTIVSYSFIKDDLKQKLYAKRKIIPLLDSDTLLYVGRPDFYYKGIDLLFEAFEIVKNEIPKAKLNIVNGTWTYDNMKWVVKYTNSVIPNAIPEDMPDRVLKMFNDKESGINYLGKADDLSIPIKKSGLFVTLGRGDPFPATGIEAMSGGLPALVSEETGTKDFIERVDKNLIVPLDAKKIARRILWYFTLSREEKLELSKEEIKLGFSKELDKKYILNKFVKDFNAMIKTME